MKSASRTTRGGPSTSTARCYSGSAKTGFAAFARSQYRLLIAHSSTHREELQGDGMIASLTNMGSQLTESRTNPATSKKGRGTFSLLFLLASILTLGTSSAHAQAGSSIFGQVITPGGTPASYAQVTICPYTASGTPCSPQSSIYADVNLTIPLTQPVSADQYGNFNVFVAAGTYLVQIRPSTTITYSYTWSANSAGMGNVSGAGAPGISCTSANVGQIYTNTTNSVIYTCNGSAWGIPNAPIYPGVTIPSGACSPTGSTAYYTGAGTPYALYTCGPDLLWHQGGGGATYSQTQRTPLYKNAGLTGTLGTSFQAQPQVVYHFAGNSLVAIDTGTATNFVPGGLAESTLAGTPYRKPTLATCTSGICTVTVPNADNFFSAGTAFTPVYLASFDSGCLADTQYVTSATATTITFSTANAWAGPCADIGSTAYTSALVPSYVRHGMNGATLATWYASGGAYGYASLAAGIQADIQAGRVPVVVIADGCIATNSLRSSALSLTAFEAQCKTFISALEAVSATGPDGLTHSMAQYPIYAESGTPYAGIWTVGGVVTGALSDATGSWISTQIQYVCTNGGPANSGGTCTAPYSAPTVTSGAISAGANTVTLNYCDPLLWPGYTVSPADFYQTAGGVLSKDGTPLYVQLDTVGSGVQEWVQVSAISPASGSGANGFPACNLTFTAANAHSAGFQVVTGNNTATQVLSSLRIQIAQDMASWYPNIFPVDTTSQLGKGINPPTNGSLISNQLHPNTNGYTIDHQPTFAMAAAWLNTGQAAPQQPQTVTTDEGELVTSVTSAIDRTFNTQAASAARTIAATSYPFTQYSKACLDDNYWFTVAQYKATSAGAGAGFVRLAATNLFASTQKLTEMQTGDVFYNYYTGCSQPTTVTSTAYYAASAVVVNYTGGPNFATAGPAGGTATGPIIIRRPLFVAPIGATFSHVHPQAIQTNWIGTVTAASTTNSLVFTLSAAQPNGDLNATCAEVSMQAGDYLVFSNNTALQVAAGTLTGASSTCTWTDTSGTNYATYSTMPMNLFGMNRSGDKNFGFITAQKATEIATNAVTGFQTTGSPIPAITTVVSGGTTGGTLSNGTYCYKLSLVPVTNTAAQDGIASTGVCYTASGGTTTQQMSVRWTNSPIPSGYAMNVYGRPAVVGGTYGLIATVTSGTTYSDLGTITPSGQTPSATDLSVTANNVYDDGTAPSASGMTCLSNNANSRACHWYATAVKSYYFPTFQYNTGATTNPVQNQATTWAFDTDLAFYANYVNLRVVTADNTGNLYSFAVYGKAGNLIAKLNATAGTTFAPSAALTNLALTTTGTVPAGRFYVTMTTNCSSACATFAVNTGTTYLPLVGYNAGTTSGAVPLASITPPADTFSNTASPWFELHQ